MHSLFSKVFTYFLLNILRTDCIILKIKYPCGAELLPTLKARNYRVIEFNTHYNAILHKMQSTIMHIFSNFKPQYAPIWKIYEIITPGQPIDVNGPTEQTLAMQAFDWVGIIKYGHIKMPPIMPHYFLEQRWIL